MEQLWKHCATAHGASRVLHVALVPEPIYRANNLGLGTDGADFLPKVLDVAIYSTIAHHAEIGIEDLDQLAAGKYPPGMGEEATQQAELNGRQLEWATVEGSAVALLIQDEPARSGRAGCLGLEATQHSLDAGDHFARTAGLTNIIICPEFKPEEAVNFFHPRRDHDDRDR